MVRCVRVRRQANAFRNPGERRIRAGFTLVELLVVIAIIGILVALLLPAIQAAREAARRSQCVNNLKQLSLGALNHESTFKHFPSGGMGYQWVGDPNYGHGRKQPGGWIYNTLPFIEEQSIHDMGSGVGTTWNDAARKAIFTQRASMTIKTYICPTRRSGGPYGNQNGPETFRNQNTTLFNARSDYAGSLGDTACSSAPSGPGTYEETLSDTWETTVATTYKNFSTVPTGIFSFWAFHRVREITDGLSKTYIIGEKYVRPEYYEDGRDAGDDQNMYHGLDRDNLRWGSKDVPLLQDTVGVSNTCGFGGPHQGIVLMAFCDGSVHGISVNIDPIMHGRLANREDGEVTSFE